MAKVDFQPERPHELLGVYRDAETAQRVLDLVQEKLHVPQGRIGAQADEVDALRAEMAEQMEHTVLAPQAGLILTKETTKGAALIGPLAIVIGMAVMLPLVFFFAQDVNVKTRLAAGLGVGAFLGGTVALVLISLGAKRPNAKLAAERGVTVRVPVDTPDVRAAMIDAKPIRLDVIDDGGRPLETLTTEEEDNDEGIVQQFGDRAKKWP
ncbi:MAG: hypothetical protein QOJ00_2041 [Actinomycetota bacterium]|jgi:hypothetical protein